jgi:hypothetical protein
MKKQTAFAVVSVSILVLLYVLIIIFEYNSMVERRDNKQSFSKKLGCEYIGSLHLHNDIKILNCSGDIVLKKIK